MHECTAHDCAWQHARRRTAQANSTCISPVDASGVEISSDASVQLFEGALQRFELLSRFGELALGRQPLIVGEVRGRFGDQRVDVGGCPPGGGGSRPVRRGRTPDPSTVAGNGPGSVDAASPKRLRMRVLERRSVREPILKCEDDEPQLRHRAVLGLQVDRLRVQQRPADRNHDQRAAQDIRPLLVPQRHLRRELRVLIDARFDLQRSVDESRLRKVVDDRRAVMRLVASRRDPADQVVPVRRRERQNLDELRSGFSPGSVINTKFGSIGCAACSR